MVMGLEGTQCVMLENLFPKDFLTSHGLGLLPETVSLRGFLILVGKRGGGHEEECEAHFSNDGEASISFMHI